GVRQCRAHRGGVSRPRCGLRRRGRHAGGNGGRGGSGVKRNYLTTVLVLLALAAIGLWIANNTHWEEVDERTPLKGEAATNPFYSVQHLAELLGAHTRLRHEIVTLPATQAVMVINSWNWGLIP